MKNSILAFVGTLALFMGAVPAVAQNPVVPFRSPRVTFTTQTGQPLSGGCIYTYQGGTTTPQSTYTDYTGGTANTNPVILDTTGSAVMWLGANFYKFVAYSAGGYNCASGGFQWTVDQIPGDAFLNGTISGATITNPTITGGTDSGTAIDSAVVTGSSIDGSAIGATTPASGSFTSLASALQAVTFSATPAFDASKYDYFTMTLTGNVTSSTLTGSVTGQEITFDICQDGTGGRTFAWPASLLDPPTVNPTAGACTIVVAFYNGLNWLTAYNNLPLIVGNYDLMTTSTTPVFAAGTYSTFYIPIAASVTSSTITGGQLGQVINIIVSPLNPSYTFAWPANLLNPPTVSPLNIGAAQYVSVTAVLTTGYQWLTIGTVIGNPPAALQSVNDMSFSATPVFAAGSYSAFVLNVITANITSSTLTGGNTGQTISMYICQDGTGGHTVAWPTNLNNAPTMASSASACTGFQALYDGTNWDVLK